MYKLIFENKCVFCSRYYEVKQEDLENERILKWQVFVSIDNDEIFFILFNECLKDKQIVRTYYAEKCIEIKTFSFIYDRNITKMEIPLDGSLEYKFAENLVDYVKDKFGEEKHLFYLWAIVYRIFRSYYMSVKKDYIINYLNDNGFELKEEDF